MHDMQSSRQITACGACEHCKKGPETPDNHSDSAPKTPFGGETWPATVPAEAQAWCTSIVSCQLCLLCYPAETTGRLWDPAEKYSSAFPVERACDAPETPSLQSMVVYCVCDLVVGCNSSTSVVGIGSRGIAPIAHCFHALPSPLTSQSGTSGYIRAYRLINPPGPQHRHGSVVLQLAIATATDCRQLRVTAELQYCTGLDPDVFLRRFASAQKCSKLGAEADSHQGCEETLESTPRHCSVPVPHARPVHHLHYAEMNSLIEGSVLYLDDGYRDATPLATTG